MPSSISHLSPFHIGQQSRATRLCRYGMQGKSAAFRTAHPPYEASLPLALAGSLSRSESLIASVRVLYSCAYQRVASRLQGCRFSERVRQVWWSVFLDRLPACTKISEILFGGNMRCFRNLIEAR
ncbi:hypothetical protein KCU90_g213, partial [Aureobasidium melanogenum]